MYLFELVGEDDAFAVYEAAVASEGIHRVGPGLAVARTVSPVVAHLAFTRCVSDFLVDAPATLDGIYEAVASRSLDRSGSAAVRARAIRGARIDSRAIERRLGNILVDEGLQIDLEAPDHVLRVVTAGERAYIGWQLIEPGDAFSQRRPTDRPFFQPGSMAPRLARALVNIAGIREADVLVDPMCGTGGILLEGGLVGARVIGLDMQRRMVEGARRNCRAITPGARVELIVGDARALPVQAGMVRAVVFDAPYGRQSRVTARDRDALVREALKEAHDVTASAVVVADRSLTVIAEDCGWTVRATFVRRVHRSLDRHIHHLTAAG